MFWEQADRDESGEHPLRRELGVRLDAMQRYRSMISDAQENGRDEAARLLLRQHDREQREVRRIRSALNRLDDEPT